MMPKNLVLAEEQELFGRRSPSEQLNLEWYSINSNLGVYDSLSERWQWL